MSIRTNLRILHFAHPFQLRNMDEARAAGSYILETDEERIEGLSFSAHRRVATRLLLPPAPGSTILAETIDVDQLELEMAQARDAALEFGDTP